MPQQYEFSRGPLSFLTGVSAPGLLGKARLWGPLLLALAATLWFAGPRAWTVLAHRVESGAEAGNTARVQLERVGVRALPPWLTKDMLIEVMRDLAPVLRGEVPIMSEPGTQALQRRIAGSPWVRTVSLRRAFPDRFVVDLELRRPELEVRLAPEGPTIALLDARGVALPAVADAKVPFTVLPNLPIIEDLDGLMGAPFPDDRAVAAARVAAEWRAEIAPRVPRVPRLVEVDAANLHYRFLADGEWSEVRVGLERGDGETAYFGYGHPPGSAYPRLDIETKARVLRSILAECADLAGIDGGDLRFANRWRDWLRPQGTVADDQ